MLKIVPEEVPKINKACPTANSKSYQNNAILITQRPVTIYLMKRYVYTY